jgi:hypothetical protein
MSSSRSIAAARARRAGEAAPPVSGNRPGTSIGSHAAFAPQPPSYASNVRTRGPPPGQQPQQQYRQPPAQQQQQQYQQSSSTNNLPFSKLSISDAVGLITLRLGRVEQFMIELQHDEQTNGNNHSSIPENSKIIDNSVLTSMINRLDSLEKREPVVSAAANSSPSINPDDFNKLTEDVKRLNDELIKHNLTIAKHTEQMFRVERDTVETRDMLKTLMLKFDMFVNETNTRFGDYEYALGELEKNIPPAADANNTQDENAESGVDENLTPLDESIPEDLASEGTNIMSVDLKNIIKQELANEF